jgi:hypothetical protein
MHGAAVPQVKLIAIRRDRMPRATIAFPNFPFKENSMGLETILLIILILMLIGAFPTWPHSRSSGYGPSRGLGLALYLKKCVIGVEQKRFAQFSVWAVATFDRHCLDANDTDAFIAAAKSRQCDREDSVRALA